MLYRYSCMYSAHAGCRGMYSVEILNSKQVCLRARMEISHLWVYCSVDVRRPIDFTCFPQNRFLTVSQHSTHLSIANVIQR